MEILLFLTQPLMDRIREFEGPVYGSDDLSKSQFWQKKLKFTLVLYF